jgi:gluconokinase
MFKGAVIVMGVTSCGKTSVGEALATRLGAHFIEGDKLHPAANIAKMSNGIPLNDDDRWPWLDEIGQSLRGDVVKIASCSALKKSYRQRLILAAQRPVTFVFLNGTREQLAERIAARKNHFMPPSLLDSQLATLEPPLVEEGAIQCDITAAVKEIVQQVLAKLERA